MNTNQVYLLIDLVQTHSFNQTAERHFYNAAECILSNETIGTRTKKRRYSFAPKVAWNLPNKVNISYNVLMRWSGHIGQCWKGLMQIKEM